MADLPSDEIMRQLTKMAIENATQQLAAKAREFACDIPKGMDGRQVLLAFANSIDSTNAALYPKGKKT